ncbi:MAG: M50 family metallopeptidase [Dehalococcoidales bacterium]
MEVQQENIYREILEFGVSVVWLAIAFGIYFAGGIKAFSTLHILGTDILESLFVVFFAFVLHELAHRIAARRYGFQAVYHVWIPGLLLAMGAALLGFLLAAPGGVYIPIGQNTAENRAKVGKSALAGPVVNMVLTVVFTVLFLVLDSFGQIFKSSAGTAVQIPSYILDTASIGAVINAWLALFNLIPWGNFDGQKVFQWNKKVWTIFFVGSIVLFVLVFFA